MRRAMIVEEISPICMSKRMVISIAPMAAGMANIIVDMSIL